MPDRFVNLMSYRFFDGEVVKEASGEGFATLAKLSETRISLINYDRRSRPQFGLFTIEGRFTFPEGQAQGQVNRISNVSLQYITPQEYTSSPAGSYSGNGYEWRPLKTTQLSEVFQQLDPNSTDGYNYFDLPGETADGVLASATSQLGNDWATGAPYLRAWLAGPSQFSFDSGMALPPPALNTIAIIETAYNSKSDLDPITNFSPKSDKLRIDSDYFGVGNFAKDFKVARSSKQLKKLQASNFNLIYSKRDGALWFNVNRSEPGFGEKGGIIAILEPGLAVTSANFEIF